MNSNHALLQRTNRCVTHLQQPSGTDALSGDLRSIVNLSYSLIVSLLNVPVRNYAVPSDQKKPYAHTACQLPSQIHGQLRKQINAVPVPSYPSPPNLLLRELKLTYIFFMDVELIICNASKVRQIICLLVFFTSLQRPQFHRSKKLPFKQVSNQEV